MLRPKHLFLSLDVPAKFYLGLADWSIGGQVYLQNILVEGNDTPWASTVADLLVDRETDEFVGMAFAIDDQEYWQSMKDIAKRLDPKVVRYNDIATPESRRIYTGHVGTLPRFEITWSSARSLECEAAQLCCGQWFWWYAKEGSWGVSPPIIALGITDIDEILDAHNLKFPTHTDFPQLAVKAV
jgi:hypothetical protein